MNDRFSETDRIIRDAPSVAGSPASFSRQEIQTRDTSVYFPAESSRRPELMAFDAGAIVIRQSPVNPDAQQSLNIHITDLVPMSWTDSK